MCIIEVLAQCYDRFFEVVPEEKDQAEFTIEEMVGHTLIHLFGDTGDARNTMVENVMIRFSPGFHAGLRHCSITIQARCSCNTFVSFPRSTDTIRYAIKESLSSIFKELFVTVKIDDVIMRHSQKCELDNTFLYTA